MEADPQIGIRASSLSYCSLGSSLGRDPWKPQWRSMDRKPRRKRARKMWILKQITLVDHPGWGTLKMIRNAHLWVIFSGSLQLRRLYSNSFQLGFQSCSWDVVNSPELQTGLNVKPRCCQEKVAPRALKWYGQRDVGGAARESLGYTLLDALLPRLSPDGVCCWGKLLLCISHSVSAPGISVHPWGPVCRYSVLFMTRNWTSVPFYFLF